MSNKKNENLIQRMRSELDHIPDRKADKITEGKARFLAQAKLIQRSPVTIERPERRSKWNIIRLKEVRMGTLVTVLVVIGMIFGGVGGTVAAAQNDLPGEPLYQLKLMSENTQLGLTQDIQKKADLELQFAMRRFSEIQELRESGIEPPYSSYARFENHLSNAINEAAQLEEPLMTRTLLRIRDMLKTCLTQTDNEDKEFLQTQLRTMLQERISWLDEGIADPAHFLNQERSGWEKTVTFGEENQYQNQEQNQSGEQNQDGEGPAYQNQPTGNGYQTPGPGYQTPGPGYQTPGPGNATPEPGYQTPGPGYQTPGPGYQTPGPGNGSGNGPKN